MCFLSRSKALSLSADAKQFAISSCSLMLRLLILFSLTALIHWTSHICIQNSLHCCPLAFKSLVNQTEPLRHSQQLHKEGKTCWWYYTRYSSSKRYTKREHLKVDREDMLLLYVFDWWDCLTVFYLAAEQTSTEENNKRETCIWMACLFWTAQLVCILTLMVFKGDADGWFQHVG